MSAIISTMNFAVIIKESFRAILRNRMRSFLTCVGIVVGIAAVILVPALGNCAKVVMVRQLEAFGTNVIWRSRPAAARSSARQ